MPDQRLTAKNGTDEIVLGAVLEADDPQTASLQVADPVARAVLAEVRDTMLAAMGNLGAAAAAMTLAANAEELQADMLLANAGALIAASVTIQTQANLLLGAMGDQVVRLDETADLVTQMTQTMQQAAGSITDLRAVAQAMYNQMVELLASAAPSLPLDPVGMPVYDTVAAVPALTETMVVMFQVPPDTSFVLAGFTATGNLEARYRLVVAAQPMLAGRSSTADRTVTGMFPQRAMPRAGAGLIIKVVAEHADVGKLGVFEATIHGYPVADPAP